MESFWPTLPDTGERFVAEMFSVMRKVCICDEGCGGAIRDLGVGVVRPHDAVHVSYEDRLDLQCAKFAMTAASEVISVGFDLNQGRKKQWMHDLMRDRVLFVRFDARGCFNGSGLGLPMSDFLLLLVHVD